MTLKIHNKTFLILGWIAVEIGLNANHQFSNLSIWAVLFPVGIVLMSLSILDPEKSKIGKVN